MGSFPDYEKLIPTEAQVEARFDTRELIRAGMAVASLGVVKDATIRLYIEESRVRLSSSDGAGEATIETQTEWEAKTAVSGRYLAQALKALGVMAELKVKSPGDPILITVDGYRLVLMPMFIQWGDEAEAPTESATERLARTQTNQKEGWYKPPPLFVFFAL